jgi:hypothetical protein
MRTAYVTMWAKKLDPHGAVRYYQYELLADWPAIEKLIQML